MKPTILLLSCSLSVGALAFTTGCQSTGENTRRGAGIGAAAGAIIGGVIGHQSGEAATGAAVGAAAGAAAGGAYGNRQDRREATTTTPGAPVATGVEDRYGYSDNEYLALMTESEVDILEQRARAAGRTGATLMDYLTDEERSNLRRRAAENRAIAE